MYIKKIKNLKKWSYILMNTRNVYNFSVQEISIVLTTLYSNDNKSMKSKQLK